MSVPVSWFARNSFWPTTVPPVPPMTRKEFLYYIWAASMTLFLAETGGAILLFLVPRFKAGFWKIAKGAGVPVLPVYFDYPRKTIGIGPLFEPGDDMQADITRLQHWYAPWRGRNRNVAQPPAAS